MRIYLVHPYETHGDPIGNMESMRGFRDQLRAKYPYAEIVCTPLDHPEWMGLERGHVISKCILEMSVCTHVAPRGPWQKSDGCLREMKNAVRIGLEEV